MAQSDFAKVGSRAREDEIVLNVLDVVERDHLMTHRKVAQELGIAVGLANAYVRRCVRKGLIKVSQVPTRRYAYYLTPKGFAEKSRLTASYLVHSFAFLRRARIHCGACFEQAIARGHHRLVLVGSGDLADIARLVAGEHPVSIAALLPAARDPGELLQAADKVTPFDAAIVVSLESPREVYDACVRAFGADATYAPELLHLSARAAADPDKGGIVKDGWNAFDVTAVRRAGIAKHRGLPKGGIAERDDLAASRARDPRNGGKSLFDVVTTLAGERALVFGGTGSLGRALVRRLADANALMLFSRDEAKHWTIRNQMGSKNVSFAVGDIRDPARVEEAMLRFRPTIIIVAAALKQVDTCEMTPYESVQTNVLGIKNVVDAVSRHVDKLAELKTVVMVSTDKACAPTNVYGMCKALAERLVTSQCLAFDRPRFVGVRYGNVLESRGSIIPLFRWQAENAGSFTVTHADMTRFVMTLDESIDLIIATANGAKSGEIWLPRLRSMRILDLATIFSERYRKPVQMIGMRPGEKLHEALISEAESVRVVGDGPYFRMAPAHCSIPADAQIFSYESNDNVLDKDSLAAYLDAIGIFARRLDDFVGRQIEEIVGVPAGK